VPVWTVKGGRQGEREERLIAHGLIGGGWEGLGSLEGVTDKEDLASRYRVAFPDASEKKASNHVGQLWSLLARMSDGDLVVLPLKTTGTVAVGRLTGGYEYRDDLGHDTKHVRPVRWIETDVPRDNFDQDLLYSFGAFLTFGQVRRDAAESRILAAIGQAPSGVATPPKASGLADVEADVEPPPDVHALAREQVRQFISRNFAGHDLARLIAAILEAQGLSVSTSPPGADRGADILAGLGPLGLDEPRIVVQVKTGQADVETYRALRGTMQSFGAGQGLLVAWNGFRGTVRQEARPDYFTVRLWDADKVLDELSEVYDRLPDDVRTELPLQRVWALVPEAEDES
jgi:restriction system protein